jgi:flotillin
MENIGSTLQTAMTIGGGVVVSAIVMMSIIKRLLHVCPPNKVLIFSGRNRTADDGSTVGFRTVMGGRGWRVPLFEQVQEMDLTNISVPMSITGAYSEGSDGQLGIPLSVDAVANVKISSDRQYVGNAIERFLGRGRGEIARVAKETLEGHLRGVLATMTPEEVNEDRLKFATRLTEEAEMDLEKLGLHLDTLKVQHVADDRNYLESIGRKRIAEVLQLAEVAESDAERLARESEAAADARGVVAKTNAQANVLKKKNELREINASLNADARSEEERAKAAAHEARAIAEKELQEIRGELEELRLLAEVTIPAETARQVRELDAAGDAAQIEADGKASADALRSVAEAWSATQGEALEMYVLQNLDGIFGEVVGAARNIKVREVNLVDSGDGSTMPAYASAYPATVAALMEQVNNTLGVDIKGILGGTDGGGDKRSLAAPPAPLDPTATTTRPEGGQSW